MIDIRCGASLDCPSRDQGRCQLLMGHEGPHAVMFGRCGHLEVRTWRVPGGVDASDHVAGSEMLPWAFGCPRTAWVERDEKAPVGAASARGWPPRVSAPQRHPQL
jgi:hypothetical protein